MEITGIINQVEPNGELLTNEQVIEVVEICTRKKDIEIESLKREIEQLKSKEVECPYCKNIEELNDSDESDIIEDK